MTVQSVLRNSPTNQTCKKEMFQAREMKVNARLWDRWKWLEEELPTPDVERQYIVLEMLGTILQRATLLTEPIKHFKPNWRKCDRLWLVQVDMRPDTMTIVTTQACPLRDGRHKVEKVTFDLTFQVEDVQQLWHMHKDKDPLKVLETQVKTTATQFFNDVVGDDFRISPADLLETTQQSLLLSRQKRVREKLEAEVQKIQVLGLKLHQVNATLDFDPDLKDYINDQYLQLQAPGNIVEQAEKKRSDHAQRQYINSLIDKDATFAPYNLRMVILALDTNLFEQFYTNDWKTAMDAVHKTLGEKYKAYVELQRTGEIEHLKKWSQAAGQFAGLKDEALRKWQQVILDKMLESRKNQQDWKEPSLHDFLRSLINQGAAGGR